MADFKEKLQPYFDELAGLFDNLQWYASKNDMSGIDDNAAVLTFTFDKSNADARPHFWRTTLVLYTNNALDKGRELAELGYEQISEAELDDHLNGMTAYNRQVLIL